MNFKGWRLQFIFLAAILSISLLTGGQWVYRHFSQEKPLSEFLKEEGAVRDVLVSRTAEGLEIKIFMGPVDNLQLAYNRIDAEVRRVYGMQAVKLVLVDNPNAELEGLWRHSQYAVYEAAVRGNLTDMADSIERLAREAGIDGYAVNVDERNIYLQFNQGNDYLYQVIPRQIHGSRGEA